MHNKLYNKDNNIFFKLDGLDIMSLIRQKD